MKYTDKVRDLEQIIYSEMIEYIKQHGYKRNVYGNETLFIDAPSGITCTVKNEPVVGFFIMKNRHEELMYLDAESCGGIAPELYLIEVANVLDDALEKAKIRLQQSFDLVMKILNTKMSGTLTKVQVCELVRAINSLSDYQYALLITMIDEATI